MPCNKILKRNNKVLKTKYNLRQDILLWDEGQKLIKLKGSEWGVPKKIAM